jgi:hypothetical protein
MAKKKHTLLEIAGVGAAGLAAYEWLYKPWRAAKDAAGAATTPLFSFGGGSPAGGGFTTGLPYITGPAPNIGGQSTLDPGANVGGPVGTCMHRKNWTQTQCETRLNALQTGFTQAKARLANWDADVAQARAALAANQAALTQAQAGLNLATANHDAAGVIAWTNAVNGHTADIAALTAQLAGVDQRKTDIVNLIAGLNHDFQALTGLTLQ